jgi:hypothetical protein
LGYAVLIVNLKRGGHAIQELDTVVLTHDVPEHSLKEGDLGAFVHIHAEEETAEVEFVRQMGVTFRSGDIRTIGTSAPGGAALSSWVSTHHR